MPIDDRTRKQFERWDKPEPSSESHGTDEDIRDKLTPLKAKSWHMEGNKLVMETEMVPVVNFLPTDIICKGMDEEGSPILEKIKLK